MSTVEIGGLKINYASLEGLGKAVEETLSNTEDKLVKAVKEVKKLRRARRALKQMLGGQKATVAAAREPAGALR